MTRASFWTLLTLTLMSSELLADAAPEPGSKYVTVTNLVMLDKPLPDHSVYYLDNDRGTLTLSKVAVDPEKATKVGAKSQTGYLFAVPNEVVKSFATEKELSEALQKKILPAGVAKVELSSRATVKASDKRDSIARILVLKNVKDMEGVQFVEDKPAKKEPEPSSMFPSAGRQLAIGMALTLSVVFAGLWFFRRK